VHFNDVFAPSVFGNFGALEYQDQDPDTAPKYACSGTMSRRTPPISSGRTPPRQAPPALSPCHPPFDTTARFQPRGRGADRARLRRRQSAAIQVGDRNEDADQNEAECMVLALG